MNSMYKRIITLGMVSITAVLAWVYSLVVYTKKPIILAVISIILVISIYALLSAVSKLHQVKEKRLQDSLRQTADDLLMKSIEASKDELAEKLRKASYIQIRKGTLLLSNIVDSLAMTQENIHKAVKAIVKYNDSDTMKLLVALNSLTENVQAVKDAITSIDQDSDYTTILDNLNYQIVELKNSMEAINNSVISNREEYSEIVNSLQNVVNSTDIKVKKDAKQAELEASVYDADALLKQTDLESLYEDAIAEAVAEETTAEETPAEEVPTEETPTEETPAEEVDPNAKMSDADIAALFAASREERKAKSDDDFKVEDHPEAMDQSLIDAILASEDDTDLEEEAADAPEEAKIADVIPFPSSEEAKVEEPAAPAIPEETDPNAKLSDDAIAALFAAANNTSAEEPKTEEVVEEAKVEEPAAPVIPEPADPNAKMSDADIAALIAAMTS